jgi:hypothetical protein
VAGDEIVEGEFVSVDRRGDQYLVGPGLPGPYGIVSKGFLRARGRVPLPIERRVGVEKLAVGL